MLVGGCIMEVKKTKSPARFNFLKHFLLLPAGLCFLYYFSGAGYNGIKVAQLWIWLFFGGFFLSLYLWKRFLPEKIKAKKWYKIFRHAFRVVIISAVVVFIAVESLIVAYMFSSTDTDLDYIIILGAKVNQNGPSKTLYDRINEAYKYLSAHPDTIAIASGGQGEDEPMSEAECIKQTLVRYGIDEKRIILEDNSTSTAENIKFSAALIPDGATVGIVSSNFHIFHAKLLSNKYIKGEVHGIAAPFPSFLFVHFTVREFFTVVWDILAGNI